MWDQCPSVFLIDILRGSQYNRTISTSMIEKIKLFFVEAKQEFHRVNWPSANETVRLTLIVIGMSIFIAVFLGAFDALFAYLLSLITLR